MLSPMLDHELSNAAASPVLSFNDLLRQVPAKEIHKGDVIQDAYFVQVLDGLVQAYRNLPKGHKVGLGIYGPGAYVFGSDPIRALSTTVEFLTWDQAAFEAAVRTPEGQRVYAEYLALHLAHRTARLVTVAGQDNRQSFANLLLDLGAIWGIEERAGSLTIPAVTHEALSWEVGTTREIATMLMRSFRSAGAIHYDRTAITIRPDVLRKVAGLVQEEISHE